ncbi:hypothetical protein [Nocardia sp. NPDC056000]|uniref:hypothetical protein n=1 Tax=Nocardia sp. NPDC056000 TaxID=3345674 RepID=UPI0035DBFD5D
MTVTEVSVREFLKQWVAGELAWANKDHKQAGWATVTDWKLRTAAQADTIKDLEDRLAATRKARDSFRDTIKQQAAQLQTKQNQIVNQARSIASETSRADTAAAESSRLASELETTRQQFSRKIATMTTKLMRRAWLIALLLIAFTILLLIEIS